ncbi:MAG: hypothetical protein OEU32_09130 [Acidimicrobiia bacterium]|nr:hypothetical protein [Acidimicrobiia bacterium]
MGHPSHSFRWWIPLVALLGVVIVGAAVVVVLFLARDEPAPKSVPEAVEEFEATTSEPDATVSGPESARPPAGVYVLDGEGREEISFPPASQDDGATMPASITHQAEGCWSFKIDYNEAHWQDWSLCPRGDGLVEMGGRTWQQWDLGVSEVSNLSTFECDPPAPFAPAAAAAGDEIDRSCIGTNDQVSGTTRSAGTVTVVGFDQIDVEEELHEVVHLRFDHELTGAQTGQERTDLWLRRSDWLPLQGARDIRIDSDSPVGTITYTERGSWQLSSTTPAN